MELACRSGIGGVGDFLQKVADERSNALEDRPADLASRIADQIASAREKRVDVPFKTSLEG
jgi:hypothetical protein